MRPSILVHRKSSFVARLRGLLGQPPPGPGEAAWLVPCRQVHTLGMAYPVDVVHLDASGTVLGVQTLRPWRVGRYRGRATGVLELRAGEAARLGLSVGAHPRLIEIQRRVTTTFES